MGALAEGSGGFGAAAWFAPARASVSPSVITPGQAQLGAARSAARCLCAQTQALSPVQFSATVPSRSTVPSLGRCHHVQPQPLSPAQLGVTMPRPGHCPQRSAVPPCPSLGPVPCPVSILHCPAPVPGPSMAQCQCAPSWALSPAHPGHCPQPSSVPPSLGDAGSSQPAPAAVLELPPSLLSLPLFFS